MWEKNTLDNRVRNFNMNKSTKILKPTMLKNGAAIIALALKDLGVKRVFLFPGGTIAPLLDELVKIGIEYCGKSFAILLTVFSDTPHRRSLIRILR